VNLASKIQFSREKLQIDLYNAQSQAFW